MNKNQTNKNGMPPQKRKINKKTLSRLIKELFSCYPRLVPFTLLCVLFSALVSAIPAVFIQKTIAYIEIWYKSGDWQAAKSDIIPTILILAALYLLSITSVTLYTQLLAKITQGFLCKMRQKMFNGMQNLPIKFFDTNKHGDIMSHYTNDIDTLRQLVSQSLPSLVQSSAIILTVLSIMLWYSVWMTLVVLLGVIAMFFVTKKIGGGSAKYFVRQQKSIGKTEAFAQEMMNGQRVIKVFCHEEQAIKDFKVINDELCNDGFKANAYANVLGPIIQNIGNILYAFCATAGGIFLLTKIPNISISAIFFGISALTIDITVPFLNMTKQFTGNVNQFSQQINAIVMGLAGAERIFRLMDQEPETDDGYVTLVNAEIDENGNIKETEKRTGKWAWKHPHNDGSLTYTELKGDVRMQDVDFEYEEGKPVLHNVSVYAEPGQQVAFVGATGAGKTTITNLINRFL